MKEYIEKEKLFDCFDLKNALGGYYAISLTAINDIPAADVVEVVRCHECVHHVDCGHHFCNMWCENCPDDGDFFCAYGEREGGVKDA